MLLGTSCALVPSGKAVWFRIEEWNMHWPKLHFLWLSINYASNIPINLSLSYAANPRTIVVKCDGSVYDVDVDNLQKEKEASSTRQKQNRPSKRR